MKSLTKPFTLSTLVVAARHTARDVAAMRATLEKMEQRRRSLDHPCPDCGRETCWIGAKATSISGHAAFSVRPESIDSARGKREQAEARRWAEMSPRQRRIERHMNAGILLAGLVGATSRYP